MVTDERSLYEASAAPIHQLLIRTAFSGLTEQEKLYAHYLSCAAWHGARIVLHQTSPEASEIFDLIMELYASCSGDWQNLAQRQKVSADEMGQFLEYAATFLSNIGNYYVSANLGAISFSLVITGSVGFRRPKVCACMRSKCHRKACYHV